MKKDYWTKSEWITKFESAPCKTYEEARQDFVNLVKDMDGVTVIEGKRGVKLIEVRTNTKLYRYEVHAESVQVKTGEQRWVKDIWDDSMVLEDVYEPAAIARVYRNVYNAYL